MTTTPKSINDQPALVPLAVRFEALAAELRKTREQLDALQRANRFYRDQYLAAFRRLRSHKAHYTTVKRRIAAGACPICNRQVADIAAHMNENHPLEQPA